jgi:hypothetical protein
VSLWKDRKRILSTKKPTSNHSVLPTKGVWQGVALDSLKFHPGLPCPTLLRPAGGPPLKRPHGHFSGSPPTRRVPAAFFYPFGHRSPYVCSLHLFLWIPHKVSQICLEVQKLQWGFRVDFWLEFGRNFPQNQEFAEIRSGSRISGRMKAMPREDISRTQTWPYFMWGPKDLVRYRWGPPYPTILRPGQPNGCQGSATYWANILFYSKDPPQPPMKYDPEPRLGSKAVFRFPNKINSRNYI